MLQFAKNTRHVFFHEFCCQRCARIPSSRGTEFAHRNVHRFKKPVHNERTSTDQTRHLAASYQLAAYIILKLLTSALRLYYFKKLYHDWLVHLNLINHATTFNNLYDFTVERVRKKCEKSRRHDFYTRYFKEFEGVC